MKALIYNKNETVSQDCSINQRTEKEEQIYPDSYTEHVTTYMNSLCKEKTNTHCIAQYLILTNFGSKICLRFVICRGMFRLSSTSSVATITNQS